MNDGCVEAAVGWKQERVTILTTATAVVLYMQYTIHLIYDYARQ